MREGEFLNEEYVEPEQMCGDLQCLGKERGGAEGIDRFGVPAKWRALNMYYFI